MSALSSLDHDPDEHAHPGLEDIDWDEHAEEKVKGRQPGAKYSKISDKARTIISEDKQCALFCGGKKCKYCSSDGWKDEQMAITGIYSNWVTDNILAMARPGTKGMKKHGIVDKFKNAGIKSVINLQKPKEHSSCGGSLHSGSGFSYNPQEFMDNDIFFYNFGWRDYGVASLATILDMVKVMQFAVSQGKVAVHCHAGLGRTGVLIACYLVFTNRMGADEAVHYVRSKRPNAIQTRGQILCIREFAQYLQPFRVVFASRTPDKHEFTLSHFLKRQKHLLHGFEARRLKHIPKIIYIVCERLLVLASRRHVISRRSSASSGSSFPDVPSEVFQSHRHDDPETYSLASTNCSAPNGLDVQVPGKSKSVDNLLPTDSSSNGSSSGTNCDKNSDDSDDDDDDIVSSVTKSLVKKMSSQSIDERVCVDESVDSVKIDPATAISVGKSLLVEEYAEELQSAIVQHETSLNENEKAWNLLSQEDRPTVLCAVMWSWLDHLKEPVLCAQDLNKMLEHIEDPSTGLSILERGCRFTIEYLLKVIVHLQPLPSALEDAVIERLLSHLTHQVVQKDPGEAPSTRRSQHWGEMKLPTARKLFHFAYRLLDIVEAKNTQP